MFARPVVHFTDSWGLSWWAHEEPIPGAYGAGAHRLAGAGSAGKRLCFSTDMVTRCLEPCPSGWWQMSARQLERLCAYASPQPFFDPARVIASARMVRDLDASPAERSLDGVVPEAVPEAEPADVPESLPESVPAALRVRARDADARWTAATPPRRGAAAVLRGGSSR